MYNLIGIAAQHKLTGYAQRAQNEVELHIGEILHLVHDDKIVFRFAQGLPLKSDHIEVVMVGFLQELPIFFKKCVHLFALFGQKMDWRTPRAI